MIIILFFNRLLTTIDIGNSAIKIAGFKKTGSKLKLVDSGISKLPEGTILEGEIQDHAVLSAELEKLIKKMKFRPKNIVTTIPNDNLVIRNIELPGAVAEELSDAIKWEADEYLPFPVEQATIDYVIVNKDHENIKIILAATRKEVVQDFLKVFQEINLKPSVMNVQPMAFISLLEYQHEELATTAIIDVGASGTRIVIGDNQGIYLFRTIDTGGNDFTKIIMEGRGMDYNEAEKYKINQGISLSEEEEDDLSEQETELESSTELATEDFIRQVSSSNETEEIEEFEESEESEDVQDLEETAQFDGLEEVKDLDEEKEADETKETDELEKIEQQEKDDKKEETGEIEETEETEELEGNSDTVNLDEIDDLDQVKEFDITEEFNLMGSENDDKQDKQEETAEQAESFAEYDLNQPLDSASLDDLAEETIDEQPDNAAEELAEELDQGLEADLSLDGVDQMRQQPHSAVEGDLLSPEANNLAFDISRSLDFFKWNNTDKNIDKIFITGGGSRLKGLVEILERELDVELERIDPFVNLATGKKDTTEKKDELAVVLGLAYSEVLKK